MLFIRSKKQKAEEELEQAHGEALARNRKIDDRASKREEASKLGASGTMLETLQAIYVEQVDQGEMIEESDEHLEELIDIQEGSGSEQRRDKLEASNKEKRDSSALGKFASGVKGAFGKVGDAFGSFKDKLSGKFGLVVLGGALLLMNKFSDELFGPKGALTKLLEWMHDDMTPAITKLWNSIAGPDGWWDKTWDGVTGFFKFIGEIFTKISDYMNQFDTDGIPGLSATETDAMFEQMGEDAGEKVAEIVSGFWEAVKGYVFTGLKISAAFFAARFARNATLYFSKHGRWPWDKIPKGTIPVTPAAPTSPVGTTPSMWSKITSKLSSSRLAPGTAINKLGSLYNTSTGQIIKTAETMAAGQSKPTLLSKLTTPFKGSSSSVGATAASAASTTSSVSASAASVTEIKKWFNKYPRLAKWGPRIPFVGKILAGSVAASIILNPETSDKEKGEALGGLIGGLLGAGKMATVGFGLGAAVGAPGGPLAIASSIAGGVIGAGAGWMGGEWAGRKLMGFLMSGDSPEQDAEDLEPAVIKANRLESLNKEIAKEKGALPQIVPTGGKALTMYNKRIDRITEMEKERDSLMSEFESLDLALNSPKIAYDTPGKMHQYMAEYKQAVTSTGKKWTDSMNQDAYNYAVNQVSADQNTNNNINYYDGSMGVHQRDMPTNILNSELQHAAGWAYS